MWTYSQSSGTLTDKNGTVVATGYSGNSTGKNNPAMEHVRGVGPAPRGRWRFVGPPYNSSNVGPYAIIMEPLGDVHGRSAFRMHGDSKSAPGTASNGCLIFPRKVRELVWKSGDRDLLIVE